MVNNSTKKIISLLMVAVISIVVFVSCGGDKVTQPNSSYEIEVPDETPSDNNSGNNDNINNGDSDNNDSITNTIPKTTLPIWTKDRDFSYLFTNR